MKFLSIIYIVALFFVLTPGIFLSLPSGGSKTAVALTHALVFGLVWHFTHKKVETYELKPANTELSSNGIF